jgi:cell division protein FtsI/penicillin-binding protein 2
MLRREAFSLLLGACALPAVEPSSSAILIDLRTGRTLTARNVTASLAPPGSTLKPFVLAGLLKRGRLRADESWPCPGRLTIAGRSFTCSHPPLASPVDVRIALAYSCNCFAAHMAERYRPGELAVELETAGFSHAASARTLDATRLEALGEDGIAVTLSELALAYRGLAGHADAAIRDGLEAAVAFGTAHLAAVPGLKVAGKTGSVRTSSGARIAWFAGFSSDIAVAVMLQGRSGGSDAAPIARELFNQWGGVALRPRERRI